MYTCLRPISGGARISVRRGNTLGSRRRRGPVSGAPRTPENFGKFAKTFLKTIAKNAVFSPILQKNFKPLR